MAIYDIKIVKTSNETSRITIRRIGEKSPGKTIKVHVSNDELAEMIIARGKLGINLELPQEKAETKICRLIDGNLYDDKGRRIPLELCVNGFELTFLEES